MFELIDLRNNFMYYYDFYVSAKERSYAEAERKYYLSAGTISRSVTKLEEILELKLINTNNRGIELTIDGERIFKKLDEIFSNSGLTKLLNIENNTDIVLTIGTTRNISDFALSKYLIKFNKRFPHIKINIFTDSASNLNDFLINHKIDVLIDYLPNPNFSESQGFKIKPIEKFNTCFACSKEYYNEVKDNIKNICDLKNYKLIIPGASRRRQMLDEILQINNLTLDPLLQMPDCKLMADVVKENKFIGYFIEEELEEYDLIKINLEEMPKNFIGIIYHQASINNIAKEFVEIVLEKK